MGALDKAKAKMEEMKGGAKEQVGDATGDRDLQTEGMADQASGNAKQFGEGLKDDIRGAVNDDR